jgi:hypothetical protein
MSFPRKRESIATAQFPGLLFTMGIMPKIRIAGSRIVNDSTTRLIQEHKRAPQGCWGQKRRQPPQALGEERAMGIRASYGRLNVTVLDFSPSTPSIVKEYVIVYSLLAPVPEGAGFTSSAILQSIFAPVKSYLLLFSLNSEV